MLPIKRTTRPRAVPLGTVAHPDGSSNLYMRMYDGPRYRWRRLTRAEMAAWSALAGVVALIVHLI